MGEREIIFLVLLVIGIFLLGPKINDDKDTNLCGLYFIDENQHVWMDYPGKIAIEDDAEHTLFPDSSVTLSTDSGKFIRGIIYQGTNEITEATCLYDVRVAVVKDKSVAIVRFQVEAGVNVTDLQAWKSAMKEDKTYEGVYAQLLKEKHDFQERSMVVGNLSCERVCAK